ncbi:hypothetical protein HMN09_00148600 [Mycena chlorophos]|uniref:Uncharacterized protein n=1 Tax=Mycena chlorophos TaxID=658473 RepID=A0A8H6WJ89_MYCCL|nr:hypothetical protein HMN09_00148600 [Mycena chlorophos]
MSCRSVDLVRLCPISRIIVSCRRLPRATGSPASLPPTTTVRASPPSPHYHRHRRACKMYGNGAPSHHNEEQAALDAALWAATQEQLDWGLGIRPSDATGFFPQSAPSAPPFFDGIRENLAYGMYEDPFTAPHPTSASASPAPVHYPMAFSRPEMNMDAMGWDGAASAGSDFDFITEFSLVSGSEGANGGEINPWLEQFAESSRAPTPFSSSPEFSDHMGFLSSSSGYAESFVGSSEPFHGGASDWSNSRPQSPHLEFADDFTLAPGPSHAAPAPSTPSPRKKKRRRKAKNSNAGGPLDPSTLDVSTLAWRPSDTEWMDPGVYSEYVEFPQGLRLTSHKPIYRLERVHGIPTEFPHFATATAFMVSFPKNAVPAKMNPDSFFRNMCPHSWGTGGGAAASTKVDARLSGLFFPGMAADDFVDCRRATPVCQGVWCCESLHQAFVREQRRELDPNRQEKLAQATMRQREQQEDSRVGQVLTFVQSLDNVRCRGLRCDGQQCDGRVRVVRELRRNQGDPPAYGLSCTEAMTALADGYRHSTLSIPDRIDTEIFLAAMAGEQVCDGDDADQECAMVLGLQQVNTANAFCDFNHRRDGRPPEGETRSSSMYR